MSRSRPRPRSARRLVLAWRLLLAALLAGAAWAQPLRGDDPAELADRAVDEWRTRSPATVAELSAMGAEELCRELPSLVAAPPPPEGTRVNLDDRQERPTEDDDRRRFTYSAVRPPEQLDVVEVVLARDGDAWQVERVGFQTADAGGRDWLQRPAAAWGFGALTLLVILGLARPSPLRRLVATGLAAVGEHRRLVIWTMVLLYGIAFLGMWTGTQLPEACESAVEAVLGDTLEQVGATQALQSGNVARAATVIFYQNFVIVSVTVLFGSALLLGVPAYLLSAASFFAQSAAFGVLGIGGFPEVVFFLALMVLEFTAYFLIVAGGGMLVVSLVRGGLAGLGTGYRKLFAMLPLTALLLLVGAWYEALIIVGL